VLGAEAREQLQLAQGGQIAQVPVL